MIPRLSAAEIGFASMATLHPRVIFNRPDHWELGLVAFAFYPSVVVHLYKRYLPTLPYVPKRYIMTALAWSGAVWHETLKSNLGVTIVAMVKTADSNSASAGECSPGENVTKSYSEDGEFDWSPDLQGIVLSSLFYGYLIMPLVGGVLAERFGGKIVFFLGISSMSLLSLFTALAARTSVYLLIVLRALEGVGSGVVFASIPVMMERWAPVSERNRLMSIVTGGSHVGIIVSQLASGLLSDSDIFGGWPSVFYIFGGCGLLSGLLWLFFVTDRPEHHPSISKAELDYILVSRTQRKQKYKIPWRAILTSRPVWASIVAITCVYWGVYTMVTLIPTYIEQILHFPIRENGLLSSIPYLVSWVVLVVAGILSDFLIKSGTMSATSVLKASYCFGTLSMAGFIIAVGHTGCDVVLNIICITLGIGLVGVTFIPIYGNSLEIAPKYAGTIFGIANSIANVTGMVAPAVGEHIIGTEHSQSRWRMVFYVTAGICIFGSLVFLVFGSGELQAWAGSVEGETDFDRKRDGVSNDGFAQESDCKRSKSRPGHERRVISVVA